MVGLAAYKTNFAPIEPILAPFYVKTNIVLFVGCCPCQDNLVVLRSSNLTCKIREHSFRGDIGFPGVRYKRQQQPLTNNGDQDHHCGNIEDRALHREWLPITQNLRKPDGNGQ